MKTEGVVVKPGVRNPHWGAFRDDVDRSFRRGLWELVNTQKPSQEAWRGIRRRAKKGKGSRMNGNYREGRSVPETLNVGWHLETRMEELNREAARRRLLRRSRSAREGWGRLTLAWVGRRLVSLGFWLQGCSPKVAPSRS
jgi:hypothetical protein